MTTFQLFISAGFPSVIVLAGILMHQIQTSAIRKDVRMLTVKVIELTDGISHLEAHIRSS